MVKSERIVVYDNAKLFLICCVVLGHLGNRYSDSSYAVAAAQFWVYLFHMPAFIFISGLFSKKTIKEQKWNKAIPYIFIFIVMKILVFFVSVINKGIGEVTFDFFSENGVPWFALAMFWWLAVSILVRNVHPLYVLITSIVLAVMAGYDSEIGPFLVLRRSITFYPFFFAGYMIDPNLLYEKLKKRSVRIISLLILACTVVLVFLKFNDITNWRLLFRGMTSYAKIKTEISYAWGWLWRLVSFVISGVLTLALISVTPNWDCFLTKIGQRTLSIFVFHNVLIAFIIGQVSFVKNWLTSGEIAIHCLIFMIFIVGLTSLKPFDFVVRKIMNVPLVKKD